MLATLLPSSMAPMKRARMSSRRVTIAARASPAFSMPWMRAREVAVSAVSAAEKKAESVMQRATTAMSSQSSAPRGRNIGLSAMHGQVSRQFVVEKAGPASARRHVRGDETLADAARQDEVEAAARHFLVLHHGVEHGLAAEASQPGHVADPGRQAGAGEMRRDPVGVGRPRTSPGRPRSGRRGRCRSPRPRHAPGARRHSRSAVRARGRTCGRG